MGQVRILALDNGGMGVRSDRFQADSGGRIATAWGAPALNLPANTPSGREGSGRRQWAADRRPEAPETDWPALVRRCLDGDHAAWAELVVSQQRRVYALCYRFTGSSHDAEDLTQDVFIKLYGNLNSFDAARGAFQTWVTTLTRNLLVDHFRRSRQQRLTDSMDAGWDQGADLHRTEPIADQRSTPLEQVMRHDLEQMVQAALTKVSPELREAVILRDLQDLDYKEIAEVLGIPQGTVKSRISRGRAELARLLERTKGQVM